ncbi:T-cell immunoreceptor with Ig and ITIM domains isoform X2 [Camelus dromedarius]|uniref:T-cell immunoreceptor with Ig and ITIM domains isoform X2 n=1 Tax=Camelus dromedarius TaxID=9838 RepID=UPI003119F33A
METKPAFDNLSVQITKTEECVSFMVFLVAGPVQFVYLLRALTVFDAVFAELGFSETLSPHRLSFTLPSAVGQFRWQKRPQLLPVGLLGRSMQWCLLLIWAQGLRQAPLPASGAVTGRIVTTGNISAEEGGSVTLQCHLSSTTAKVTQVNWEQQDHALAIHHTNLGWHIDPAFTERVVPGPHLGLTLRLLTMNDTGEYSCIYHTYPDGIYKGILFLEVLQSSVAEHSAGFLVPLLGATATALVVICTAVIVVVTVARKICSDLEEGAGLLKTHLSQSLIAGCSPREIQERFSRGRAAVSHSQLRLLVSGDWEHRSGGEDI